MKFLHKYVGEESAKTARVLSESEEIISRESVENFKPKDMYKVLLKESPALMTVLHGASSSQQLDFIEVQSF